MGKHPCRARFSYTDWVRSYNSNNNFLKKGELQCTRSHRHEGMHESGDFEWLHNELRIRRALFEPLRIAIEELDRELGDVQPFPPLLTQEQLRRALELEKKAMVLPPGVQLSMVGPALQTTLPALPGLPNVQIAMASPGLPPLPRLPDLPSGPIHLPEDLAQAAQAKWEPAVDPGQASDPKADLMRLLGILA